MPLPINDTTVAALSQLIDDSRSGGEYREPSHSDLDFYIGRVGLTAADPKHMGQVVGKAKRLRAVLSLALDADITAGANLIELVLSKLRACGGFRDGSPIFVGAEAISNAIAAFDAEGFALAPDGSIGPKVLTALSGRELTAALKAHARRAQRGAEDAALLFGTGKDLLESAASHVLHSRTGAYPSHANFEALLAQAYMQVGLAIPAIPPAPGEHPIKAMERALFQTACSINRMRNKEGTGHGRPWETNVSPTEARAAVEMAGSIAGFILGKLIYIFLGKASFPFALLHSPRSLIFSILSK